MSSESATGDRVVMMVASLRPEKAHEALLEAAKNLVAGAARRDGQVPGRGRGPARGARSRRSVRAWGSIARCFSSGKGRTSRRSWGLRTFSSLPSHAAVETLPLAVLEAMAAGVPVVASAVGSVPEIIEDGRTGRLIAPADAVGLSKAICHIFDKREETQQIISKARETVRARYTVGRMVSRYEELFERLAGARTRNHGQSHLPR